MIITLIGIGLVVLGIICLFISERSLSYDMSFSLYACGAISFVIGLIITIVTVIVIFLNHTCVNNDIYTSKLTYESLIDRIEYIDSDYEDVSKSEVIKDVYEWNKSVHSAKYWSSNPWTNWFWSQKYVDSLEYIELEDFKCL